MDLVWEPNENFIQFDVVCHCCLGALATTNKLLPVLTASAQGFLGKTTAFTNSDVQFWKEITE